MLVMSANHATNCCVDDAIRVQHQQQQQPVSVTHDDWTTCSTR